MSVSDHATLVKQGVDIVDVIAQVVSLRRTGNRYTGLCPFHQEKTPSFHVDAENQFYHCFGCGSGGDVLSFVMRYQNLSFGEALRYLADRYHISLPEIDSGRPVSSARVEASKKENEELYRVLEIASDFFYRQLHHSRAGKVARDYLVARALPPSVVETERLGYAPNQWDGLLRHIEDSGIEPELGLKAGLLAKTSKDRIYDRFRGRLIFPIRDDRGRVVAFGGRSLSLDPLESKSEAASAGSYEPKYLNSPETPVYHKGRMLYQFARAREACRQTRQVVLVEGYMDLLAFHAQEFYSVAATLGTALTSHQARLLTRICDEVVLAYDGDEAGERAMLQALPIFLQEQLAVSCICFPGGMDPDDYLKANGLPEFQGLVRGRRELGAFAIEKKLAAWDGTTVGKAVILTELQHIMEAVRQPVVKSEYLRLIAEKLALAEKVVQDQFLHLGRRSPGKPLKSQPAVLPRLPQTSCLAGLEESILRAMIKYPVLIGEVKRSGAVEHFEGSHCKAIAEILLHLTDPDCEDLNANAVYDRLPNTELKELFTRFLLESGELCAAEVHLQDWVKALCEQKAKRERLDVQEALRQAEQKGDMAECRRLLARLQSLHLVKQRVRGVPEKV